MWFYKILSAIFSLFLKKRKIKTEDLVVKKGLDDKSIVDVTIVLNLWKRPHFEEQLLSIINQTVIPKELWIIHYENHIVIKDILEKYYDFFPFINVISSSKNLKYFGRFSITINCTTEYIWLVDDDVIPGNMWLENCTNKCLELNSIIACNGRIIPEGNYQPDKFDLRYSFKRYVGVPKGIQTMNFCKKDTVVDYGCNSYFFKREWLNAYWSIWPITFLTGEDIHLSAVCKVKLGVSTIVLQQDNENNNGNLYTPYGSDEVATWKQNNFLKEREKVLCHLILEKGWIPIEWGK